MYRSYLVPDLIDHGGLVDLVEARLLRRALVVGQPGGWSLLVEYGVAERVLGAQRSRRARVFRQLETLVSYLKRIGIERFDVDAAEYEATGGTARARPDRADALRRAHAAAAHDAWFRGQVEAALREADDPGTDWVPHDVVKEDAARQRADLLSRLQGQTE